jgi:hypothetical protein
MGKGYRFFTNSPKFFEICLLQVEVGRFGKSATFSEISAKFGIHSGREGFLLIPADKG